MEHRDEFVNRTQGWVGVVRVNRKGDEKGDTVEPGGRVFLTAEEQELTARAHRRPEDSPFVERTITHFDFLTHEPTRTFVAPLLEKVKPEPETAAAPEPADDTQPRTRKIPSSTGAASARGASRPPARRRKAAAA